MEYVFVAVVAIAIIRVLYVDYKGRELPLS